MKARNNKKFIKLILHFSGILCCIIPPIICTVSYFPLWSEAGAEYLVSGGTALLIILSMIPLYKYIKKLLESCASYVLWLLIFLFCFLMSKVIDEITVIAFVGFVGNIVGAALMKVSEMVQK